MLNYLRRVVSQTYFVHKRIQDKVQVVGDTFDGFRVKEVGTPAAVFILTDKGSACRPDPRGKVVRDIPVVFAGKCKCANFRSVVTLQIQIVDFFQCLIKALVGFNVFGGNLCFLENRLVHHQSACIDKPRD